MIQSWVMRTGHTTTLFLATPTAPRNTQYSELVAAHQQTWSGSREQPYIPEVTAGWDKRPWEGSQGLNQKPGWYFPDRTPAALGQFLRSAIEWMDEHPEQTTKERLILVYAWNEFGEGGYVAPTKGDPEGRYLEAVKSAVLGEGPVFASLNDDSMYARPDCEE